ncbi:MAG TPA: sulfatase-like hydrolase/transferase [Sedimentisphaerales bacterium]|nr:sulfatase-like hydrolase/transferase [Sedimentisphaerales bacterium]
MVNESNRTGQGAGLRRREFLKTTALVTAGAMLQRPRLFAASVNRTGKSPNILVIITDQQFADAMSCCIGRDYIHTPNMDSLAASGMRFTRAYCPNPLCVPSRTSMFTGHYLHETGIQTNAKEKIDPDKFICMGRIFKEAGYDTGFFGKWHMPFKEANSNEHGFDTYIGKEGRYSGVPASQFIRLDRERPFLAIASFLNPHNICEWSRGQKLPGGPIGEPPEPQACPPLKPNMAPPEGETDIISHMRKGYQTHRLFPVGNFTNDKWRQYRWAYYRLIEKVDRHVGTLLDALRESGQQENTLIVFLSDHGECHGVHRWNQKTVFYDEAARVPLIISQKGRTPQGTCDTLVQTGVDLIPTLCDFAGIDVPKGLPGRSLKACALNQSSGEDRPYIVVSNKMVQCEPVDGVMLQPDGRMVRSQKYKYCLYSLGQRRESLVDMKADPGEMVNLAAKRQYRKALLQHREFLRDFALKHDDSVALSMLRGLDSPNS